MKHSVRAAIINGKKEIYMVQYRDRVPKASGKWVLPGHILDSADDDHELQLTAELKDAFGDDHVDNMEIQGEVLETLDHDRTDHFYLVVFYGDEIDIQDEEEISQGKWFDQEDLQKLSSQGKLLFGFEGEVLSRALEFV